MALGSKFTILIRLFLLAVLIFGAGCTQAAVPVTTATFEVKPLPSSTTLPPTLTLETLPPTWTATPEPTATATVLPSATATNTPAPTFGPAADGISAWCLPEEADLLSTTDPANPPSFAKIAKWNGQSLEVNNLPSNGCVFLYTFNQNILDPLKLEVFAAGITGPFLTADLVPVPRNEKAAYAVLRHSYIITPPVWDISFTFVVSNSQGQKLRTDQVNLHRWVPKLCWNGRRPNPLTLRCPLPQDQHPWDPYYGTPMPTGEPEEND